MRLIPILAAVAALAMPVAANAGDFVNGGFEIGTNPNTYLTLTPGSTDLTGWTIDSGSIDYIGSYWQPGSGSRSLDLSGFNAGSISQTFDTIAGKTYSVAFLLAVNPGGYSHDPLLNVFATGNALQAFSFGGPPNSSGAMGWESKNYAFTAAGNTTTLSFASLNNSVFGPALDDVNVTISAVPEPTTWAMLIVGFAAIGFALRRRRPLTHATA